MSNTENCEHSWRLDTLSCEKCGIPKDIVDHREPYFKTGPLKFYPGSYGHSYVENFGCPTCGRCESVHFSLPEESARDKIEHVCASCAESIEVHVAVSCVQDRCSVDIEAVASGPKFSVGNWKEHMDKYHAGKIPLTPEIEDRCTEALGLSQYPVYVTTDSYWEDSRTPEETMRDMKKMVEELRSDHSNAKVIPQGYSLRFVTAEAEFSPLPEDFEETCGEVELIEPPDREYCLQYRISMYDVAERNTDIILYAAHKLLDTFRKGAGFYPTKAATDLDTLSSSLILSISGRPSDTGAPLCVQDVIQKVYDDCGINVGGIFKKEMFEQDTRTDLEKMVAGDLPDVYAQHNDRAFNKVKNDLDCGYYEFRGDPEALVRDFSCEESKLGEAKGVGISAPPPASYGPDLYGEEFVLSDEELREWRKKNEG